MPPKPPRRTTQPILLQSNTATALTRLPLDGKDFNEAWIQQLIAAHPELLPVGEIEPGFSPLIAAGRELATPVGYLDNLFVSPDGYLTIVETKLWRNPEARREVVGQIIDYAKELSKWTYTDLNNAVITSSRLFHQTSDGLVDLLRRHAGPEDIDEVAFIDNLSRNLQRGRFLLLIVGDGIRESVEEMIEYLSQSPQLHFTLALVELQVYRLGADNSSLLILPQVVTRTKEIIRAIVRIDGAPAADLKVHIETDLGTEAETKKVNAPTRLTITAEDFYEQLLQHTNRELVAFAKQILKDAETAGWFVDWNTGSYSVKCWDPGGSGIKIGLFNVDRNGLVYLGFSQWAFQKLGLPMTLLSDMARDTAGIIPNIQYNPSAPYTWNRYAALKDLQAVYPAFLERIRQYTIEIAQAGEASGM